MKRLKEENIELLQRKRIVYELEYGKKPTPSRDTILKDVAKDLDVNEELIKIRHIYPHFGVEKAKIIVHIYKTKEALKRFEEVNKRKKSEKVKESGKEKGKEQKSQ